MQNVDFESRCGKVASFKNVLVVFFDSFKKKLKAVNPSACAITERKSSDAWT